MKAILSAPGSRGDVNPMIAIGKALGARGWDVVISLAEPYADLAARAGLQVEPLISTQRFNDLLGQPHLWKPIRGARTMLGTVAAEWLPLHYEVIEKHLVAGQTTLVSHPLDLASRVFREAHQDVPLVDVHLAPSMLRTFDSPAKMTPWSWEVSRPEWLVRFAYGVVDRMLVDPVIAPQLNRLRARLGLLEPVRRVIHQWWLSPDRILAMYPDWFAPATAALAPRLVHCGFPLQDIDGDDLDDRALISLCHREPIVFTSGTVHRNSRAYFERCAEACVELDHPGLLVSTDPENFPHPLPGMVRTLDYVSFAKLFARVKLVVHHGGVGTTSQCFAAGVPQLIRPMAYDQFDNARHVERLGVGASLRRDGDMAGVLSEWIDNESAQQRCQQVAQQIQTRSGEAIDLAVQQIISAATTAPSGGPLTEA